LHMCSHTWLPARQEQRTGLRELLQWLALDCVGPAVTDDEELAVAEDLLQSARHADDSTDSEAVAIAGAPVVSNSPV